MAKLKRLIVLIALTGSTALVSAGDFLFVNPAYLAETREVITESKAKAPGVFNGENEAIDKFNAFAEALDTKVVEEQRKQVLKKVKSQNVKETEDAAFAEAMRNFKDALGAMAEVGGQPIEKIVPSYDRWNKLETAVVKRGLDKRLADYNTRFGPDSEPINLLEFVVSQKFLAGDERGPSPWEPIARIDAVQAVTEGSGITSTIQLGLNHYFVGDAGPGLFKWIGLSNHVGLAATLQYLDNPGIFELKGRPSFGLMVHLDRKQVGVSWDNAEDRLNLTVGYAFQFVPMVM